jgi:hypothetical protein
MSVNLLQVWFYCKHFFSIRIASAYPAEGRNETESDKYFLPELQEYDLVLKGRRTLRHGRCRAIESRRGWTVGTTWIGLCDQSTNGSADQTTFRPDLGSFTDMV